MAARMVGQGDTVLRSGDGHFLQEFGPDLVPEAARAAVDADDDVVFSDPERVRHIRVEYPRHFLHLEIMVAGAERAHLVTLALLRVVGHAIRPRAAHLAALLDALEIGGAAPALLHGPGRATRQHRIHFGLVQADGTGAPEPGWNFPVQGVGQHFLGRHDLLGAEPGVQASDAARYVVADPSGGDDAALVRIEGGHAADRKTIAPVCVGHGVRAFHDAGQGGDVAQLFVHLAIHGANQGFVSVDHRGHAHGVVGSDFPLVVGVAGEEGEVHDQIGFRFQVSGCRPET
jgi:hypothetical protein